MATTITFQSQTQIKQKLMTTQTITNTRLEEIHGDNQRAIITTSRQEEIHANNPPMLIIKTWNSSTGNLECSLRVGGN